MIMLLSGFSVYGEDTDATVIANYQSKMGTMQGVDNWYFCTFLNGEPTLFEYYPNVNGGQWGPTNNPRMKGDVWSAGASVDVGLMIEAPMKGMVRLQGKCSFPSIGNGKLGDGVDAIIMKDNKVLWSQHVVYGSDAGVYDVSVYVRQGDKIKFIVNKHGNDAYDSVAWWPSVSYIAGDYAGEDTYKYFEKSGTEFTQIEYDADADRYPASDGIAFMSEYDVMASDKYSLVKRFTVNEDGRYRVRGSLSTDDKRGGGNVVTIRKNDKIIWSQLIPSGETGNIDVRMLAFVGDNIDVEVSKNEFAGYNYAEWECEIAKYAGSIPFSKASTSTGDTCGILDEYTLSSLITTSQGNGSNYYLKHYGEKYPMSYNTSNSRWTHTKDSAAYLTKTKVMPGTSADVIIDIEAPKDGTMRIKGELGVNNASDGVLTKVLHNGKVIWSSRMGKESSVRWNEPYDVSYFINDINATAVVKQGDILSFTFGRWRKNTEDLLDTSKVKLSYITGSPLTKTTKWKINCSTMVDTFMGSVYKDGEILNTEVFIENGTTYISEDGIKNLFGSDVKGVSDVKSKNGKQFMPIIHVAEANGKTVVWAADRLVLIHDEIQGFFGYPELCEIDAALKGGVLFE